MGDDVSMVVDRRRTIVPERKGVRRQRRFLIGGALILLALGYLAFTVTRASAVYYLTVPELYKQKAEAHQHPVRVSAIVDPGSIVREPDGFVTRFTASDPGGTLPVSYRGALPDIFQPGIQVVVEGKLDGDGVFQADSLLTKCPAHFKAATPPASASR
ncbi:MAG: cytochrome c maturation protein CcmE [Dehalococcoidia bacterium]